MTKSSTPKNIIKQGSRIVCDSCKRVVIIPIDIEKFPVEIVCQCGHHEILVNKVIPKIDPIENLGKEVVYAQEILCNTFSIYENQVARLHELFEATEARSNQPEEEPRDNTPPFYKSAKRLGELIAEMSDTLENLQQNIQGFRDTVEAFFLEQYQKADKYRNSFRPEFMPEFLSFPFCMIPAVCEEDVSKKYSRYVISPKFFEPRLGFKVSCNGGMNIELVNQYSRMSFPLEPDEIEELGVPGSLDLKIFGSKITGKSLSLCWRDIPGLSKDSDFSEEFPSVMIRNNYHARSWLADHGVVPWSARELTLKDMSISEPYESIKGSPLYKGAFDILMRCGRIGIFWPDAEIMRSFAHACASMIKGITPIFVPGNQDKFQWRETSKMGYGNASNDFCYFTNGDNVMWDAFMKTKSCIVDMTGGLKRPIDIDFLVKLFDYQGILILICRDPVLDFPVDNIYSRAVHALCGYEHFAPSDLERLKPDLRPKGIMMNVIKEAINITRKN